MDTEATSMQDWCRNRAAGSSQCTHERYTTASTSLAYHLAEMIWR